MSHSHHFILKPETCVDDMLKGVALMYPALSVNIKSRITFYAKSPSPNNRQVGLLTGGGSGHEPFAAGFVGDNMLTAAVAGSVFSSPPASHILTAILNVASVSPGGVLVLILNYTGDILNFALAVERAKSRGHNVTSIIIDEDCAIDNPLGAGKRGLCGCLFMIKIAGGMSSMSKNLQEIYYECALVKKSIATLGVTLKPCNMPGVGPMFEIEEGTLEIGVGIHGEAGAAKMKTAPADEIVAIILEKLCKTLNVKSGDRVCLIVNNLGGSSELELLLVAGLAIKQLSDKRVDVVRQYAGSLMTSLDMAGMQLSMLLLPKNDKLWLDCLDAPTTAFGWPGSMSSQKGGYKKDIVIEKEKDTLPMKPPISEEEASVLKRCLKAVAEAIQQNELKLNELDRSVGDGDTGSTLRRLADAILQDLEKFPVKHPQLFFLKLSHLAEEVMGGTSGALYSLMFVGASRHCDQWLTMPQGAMDMVMTYSKARVGSRTMFDALIPASDAFKEVISTSGDWKDGLSRAVEAAEKGCKQTLHQKPLFGRATYVNQSKLTQVDAGAYGVTVWLNAVKSILT